MDSRKILLVGRSDRSSSMVRYDKILIRALGGIDWSAEPSMGDLFDGREEGCDIDPEMDRDPCKLR